MNVMIELFICDYYKSNNKNGTQSNHFLTLVLFPAHTFISLHPPYQSDVTKTVSSVESQVRGQKNGIGKRRECSTVEILRLRWMKSGRSAINWYRHGWTLLILLVRTFFSRLYAFFGRFCILLIINVII